MKKILSTIICLLLFSEISYAREGEPTFEFDLRGITPPAKESDSGGLSGGAVTAITLGSIGVASLLGIGGLIYKKKFSEGLQVGNVYGKQKALEPFCMEVDQNSACLMRIQKNYPYLQKGLNLFELKECPNAKYLLIYDTSLGKNRFDVVKFEIPQGVKNIKIGTVTNNIDNVNQFESVLYGKNDENSEPEKLEYAVEGHNDSSNGIIFNKYDLMSKPFSYGELIITNLEQNRTYAVVIEFNFK